MLKLLFSLFMIIWISIIFKGLELILILFLFLRLVFINLVDRGRLIFKLGGDLLRINLFLLSVWITILIILARFKEMLYENKYFKFYLFFMLFLLYLCFYRINLIIFYFFFESILFPIIIIIFNWGNQPERLQAGIYILIYTLLGSLPLFILIILLREYSLNYLLIDFRVFKPIGYLFFFIILGFLVKVPMFFVHLWLPKAHVEAPISGSIILAAVLLKLGIYGIYRFKMFFISELIEIRYMIIVISILGRVIVGVICLFQTDVKSLIAYSSVCHIGIVLRGTMRINFLSSFGSLLLILGHGLCSSGLFCLGNILYERFFTRRLLLLKGINKIFPSVSLWWFLIRVFNIAAPPSINIFGEIFLLGRLLKFSIIFLFPLMLLLFLRAGYSLYLFRYINHGEGWVTWASNLISLREHSLIFLHFFPLIVWVLKIECFQNWI